MIARSETEFDLFQKMDVERRETETQGRLIQDDELPDFLVKADDEVCESCGHWWITLCLILST